MRGDRVLAFVNGMGGTPLMELYVVYAALRRYLEGRGITIERSLVGSYMTALDMAGCSITLLRLDDELTALWDAPVNTPGAAVGHVSDVVTQAGVVAWLREFAAVVAAAARRADGAGRGHRRRRPRRQHGPRHAGGARQARSAGRGSGPGRGAGRRYRGLAEDGGDDAGVDRRRRRGAALRDAVPRHGEGGRWGGGAGRGAVGRGAGDRRQGRAGARQGGARGQDDGRRSGPGGGGAGRRRRSGAGAGRRPAPGGRGRGSGHGGDHPAGGSQGARQLSGRAQRRASGPGRDLLVAAAAGGRRGAGRGTGRTHPAAEAPAAPSAA